MSSQGGCLLLFRLWAGKKKSIEGWGEEGGCEEGGVMRKGGHEKEGFMRGKEL